MTGRTPAEAIQRELDSLQLTLSCVTDSVLNNFGGYHAAERPHLVTLGDGGRVRLSGGSRLQLAFTQHYRVIESPGAAGPWTVTIVAYYYTVQDADRHEVFAYHWHPLQRGAVTRPHLHLGYGAKVGRSEIANAHLPSEGVSLESIVRLLITELGVDAQRTDWEDILARSEAFFPEAKT